MVKLSVVMPVYNSSRFIASAVASILNQTFSDFEFIIIDDGSTDNSLEILKTYQQQDYRIRLISRGNKGLIATLNEAIVMAGAPLIARMDADDISYPERLAKQFTFLQENQEYVAVGTRVQLIDEIGDPICFFAQKTTHDDIDTDHLNGKGGAIVHPASMFRVEAFHKVGGYRAEYIHAEDFDLWLRMAEVGKLANLPEVLFDYRMHAQSIGHQFREQQVRSTNQAIIETHARRPELSQKTPVIVAYKEPLNAIGLQLKWGWWALNAGNIKTARKFALRCLQKQPFCWDVIKLGVCSLRGH